MKIELEIMGINEKTVRKRIRQLQQYRQLATSVKGAKVILKFAALYHLEGDFQQIKNIASVRKVYFLNTGRLAKLEIMFHSIEDQVSFCFTKY